MTLFDPLDLSSIPTSSLVFSAVVALIGMAWLNPFAKKKWDCVGKHCIVTGGSQGLGLALAKQLLERGANVTIVARNVAKLEGAIETLKASLVSPHQLLNYASSDLSTSAGAKYGLIASINNYGGKAPDAVFLCAGGSTPGFFLEQSDETLIDSMNMDYWSACFFAKASATLMAQHGIKGKIVFVSSTLGYMGIPGYSSYAPAKHALRGLADTLRSELMLYDISVHCLFPSGILSPGFEKEELIKPQLTKDIEGGDEPLTPERVASGLLYGIDRGYFHITNEIVTGLFRCTNRGIVPYNNSILDNMLAWLGWIGLPFWRMYADHLVDIHKKEHTAHLVANGFYKNSAPNSGGL